MAKQIMDAAAFDRTLMRMSHEIIEKNGEEQELILFGIYRRGVPLAKAIGENLRKLTDISVSVGTIDITFYRDDLTTVSEIPKCGNTTADFSVEGKTVVLVDDVIFTGRTARAAMEAVISMGRPKKIQLAVLVDRGHRELPIRGDYIGKNIPTSKSEVVSVCIPEYDGTKEVIVK